MASVATNVVPFPVREKETSDEVFVARAKSGDRDAMKTLYQRHAPFVARVVANTVRDDDAAKDIVQDTFVTAFAKVGTLKEPSLFRAWATQIAVSLCRRRLRWLRMKRALGFVGEDALDDEAFEPWVPDAERAEASAQLRACFRLLEAAQVEHRSAWSLRYIEELTLPEVAQTLGCSLATAKRWISSADSLLQAPKVVPHDL